MYDGGTTLDNAKYGQPEKMRRDQQKQSQAGVRERGSRKGPEMRTTLASFTEQATLTHREGDYSKEKTG